MSFTEEQLNGIYDRTSGYCHICHKKVAFKNYGQQGAKGAWEVEHSVPRAKGGTNHLNNLYPACIPCNRAKGTRCTKSVRAENGVSKAPLSVTSRQKAKNENALAGGVIGGTLGSVFGPLGVVIGAALGAKIGNSSNPDRCK